MSISMVGFLLKKAGIFLTGDEQNISKLAKAAGYKFKYDSKIKQYAHAAVLTFLTLKEKFLVTYMEFNSNIMILNLLFKRPLTEPLEQLWNALCFTVSNMTLTQIVTLSQSCT